MHLSIYYCKRRSLFVVTESDCWFTVMELNMPVLDIFIFTIELHIHDKQHIKKQHLKSSEKRNFNKYFEFNDHFGDKCTTQCNYKDR